MSVCVLHIYILSLCHAFFSEGSTGDQVKKVKNVKNIYVNNQKYQQWYAVQIVFFSEQSKVFGLFEMYFFKLSLMSKLSKLSKNVKNVKYPKF